MRGTRRAIPRPCTLLRHARVRRRAFPGLRIIGLRSSQAGFPHSRLPLSHLARGAGSRVPHPPRGPLRRGPRRRRRPQAAEVRACGLCGSYLSLTRAPAVSPGTTLRLDANPPPPPPLRRRNREKYPADRCRGRSDKYTAYADAPPAADDAGAVAAAQGSSAAAAAGKE